MNDSIEQLEYLYGELSANSLFLTHKLRQNEEILEQNIIKILNKLLRLVDSVEELNHLHYDVDKAILNTLKYYWNNWKIYLGFNMIDKLVIECLNDYAESSCDEPTSLMINELIRLSSISLDNLINRVVESTGCDKKTIYKIINKASRHKEQNLLPRMIAEDIN